MSKSKGLQATKIETLGRVNELLTECIELCESVIETADKDELPCRNFKRAVQGWEMFRSFVQGMVGVVDSFEIDRQTDQLLLLAARSPTGKGRGQSNGLVNVKDARSLVAAMKSYLGLNELATKRCREKGMESLQTRNFRAALDGCAAFAQFTRSIAGTLKAQPLLDEFLGFRKAAEVRRAKAAISQALDEFENESNS